MRINSSFIRAQKSIDFTFIYNTLKELEHQEKSNSIILTDEEKKLLKLAFEMNDVQKKNRMKEIKTFLEQSEELYLNQEFEVAFGLLGFLDIQTEKSGLMVLNNSIRILMRKISRTQDILSDLSKLELEYPSKIPPMSLQMRVLKLDMIWEDCQSETVRGDSIHPDVILKVEKIRKNVREFMNTHGITFEPVPDKKYQQFWNTTKKNIDLKSKEMKLNHFISSAKSIESLPQAKEVLQKAYKMIQEHPSHFSFTQSEKILEMINEIDGKMDINNADTNEKLDNILNIMNQMKFKEAEEKLTILLEELKKKELPEAIFLVEKALDVCLKNAAIHTEFNQVERLYEQNDLLGSKAALLKFKTYFESIEEGRELILESFLDRINQIELKISGSITLKTKAFDPFEGLSLTKKIEDLSIKKKAKQDNSDLIEDPKNLKQPPKSELDQEEEQRRKEKDALDALDDLFDEQFD